MPNDLEPMGQQTPRYQTELGQLSMREQGAAGRFFDQAAAGDSSVAAAQQNQALAMQQQMAAAGGRNPLAQRAAIMGGAQRGSGAVGQAAMMRGQEMERARQMQMGALANQTVYRQAAEEDALRRQIAQQQYYDAIADVDAQRRINEVGRISQLGGAVIGAGGSAAAAAGNGAAASDAKAASDEGLKDYIFDERTYERNKWKRPGDPGYEHMVAARERLDAATRKYLPPTTKVRYKDARGDTQVRSYERPLGRVGVESEFDGRPVTDTTVQLKAMEDDALRNLKGEVYQYKPAAQSAYGLPAGPQYGDNTRNLRENPITAQAVRTNPQGYEEIDVADWTRAQTGLLGRVGERLDRIEQKLGGATPEELRFEELSRRYGGG